MWCDVFYPGWSKTIGKSNEKSESKKKIRWDLTGN